MLAERISLHTAISLCMVPIVEGFDTLVNRRAFTLPRHPRPAPITQGMERTVRPQALPVNRVNPHILYNLTL